MCGCGRIENCTVASNNLAKTVGCYHAYFYQHDGGAALTEKDKFYSCIFAANSCMNVPSLSIVLNGGFIESCVGDFETDGIAKVASAEAIFRRPAKGDWRLRANSPARDIIPKAELTADLPATDLGGNPRVYSVGLDAGCYECMSGGMMLLVR